MIQMLTFPLCFSGALAYPNLSTLNNILPHNTKMNIVCGLRAGYEILDIPSTETQRMNKVAWTNIQSLSLMIVAPKVVFRNHFMIINLSFILSLCTNRNSSIPINLLSVDVYTDVHMYCLHDVPAYIFHQYLFWLIFQRTSSVILLSVQMAINVSINARIKGTAAAVQRDINTLCV